MLRHSITYFGAFALGIVAAHVAAQATGDYAANLATLYNERHRLVAFKDACSRVLPKLRRDTQAAYEQWVDRHEDVLENLEARFLMMIKQASRDEKEYERNYARYHEAVMHERQTQKDTFLAMPKPELLKECREFPAYLRGPQSDMYNKYPEEFNSIYGKKK
jgi:hypothetical protein